VSGFLIWLYFSIAKSNLCTSFCRLSSSSDILHQYSRLSPLLVISISLLLLYSNYIVLQDALHVNSAISGTTRRSRNANDSVATAIRKSGSDMSAELHRVSRRRRGRPLVSTDVKTRFGIFQKLLAQRERDAEWGARVARASKKASETSALDNVWTCRRRHATFVHWDFNADASTRTRKSIMEYVVNMKIGKRSLYRGKP